MDGWIDVSSGERFPALKMGDDPTKCHILPGEVLVGTIVKVFHSWSQFRDKDGNPKRQSGVSVKFESAKMNTQLVGGTFTLFLSGWTRTDFMTHRLGVHDKIEFTYKGFGQKTGYGNAPHILNIRGQHSPQSVFVEDHEENQAKAQNAQTAPPANPQQGTGFTPPLNPPPGGQQQQQQATAPVPPPPAGQQQQQASAPLPPAGGAPPAMDGAPQPPLGNPNGDAGVPPVFGR